MNLVRLDPPADGPTNMARDCALLESAESGSVAVRVYSWCGPWVTLGRFQRPDVALVSSCGVPFVTRPTGGKSVLHGHDVTVGMAVPLSRLGLPEGTRRLRDVYRAVVRPLVVALNECGVPASLAEDTPFVRSTGRVADCFAHVAANDIVSPQGVKVCGCGLRLTETAVLVQASAPAAPPLVDPGLVFNGAPAATWSPGPTPSTLAESLERALEHLCDNARG